MIAVSLLVVLAIMILDPSLRPGFVEQLLYNSESAGHDRPQQTGDPSGDTERLGMLGSGSIPKLNELAPDFALLNLSGEVINLSDFRGEKHVVLNFWATWCTPCKTEMPDLEEIYQRHGDELVVVGVDIQESKNAVQEFLEHEVQVTYPILLDIDGRVTSGYNIFAQPTTFFINKEGIISPINGLSGKFGAFTTEELRERIDQFIRSQNQSNANE